MWDLPGLGIKPLSPALVGGSLTTAPPGKSLIRYFFFFSLGIVEFWRLSLLSRHMLFTHREACQSEREGAGARAPEAAPGGAGQGSEGVGAAEAEGAGPGALAQGEVGALMTAERAHRSHRRELGRKRPRGLS